MKKTVPVNMSNKHLHITQADLEVLFGEGHQLTKMKDLSQPGQYACEEKVDVVGPKGTSKGVRILGPVRPETQLEVSMFDARTIGVDAVVRASGSIAGTPGCKLVGPKGELTLEQGVIVAARHIHMNSKTAAEYGVTDKQEVSVRVGEARSVIFEKVVCRVSDSFGLDMHIDIEEGNAAGIKNGALGEIL